MLLVLDLLLRADSHWRIIRIYKSDNYINKVSKNELFTDHIYKNYIYCLYNNKKFICINRKDEWAV